MQSGGRFKFYIKFEFTRLALLMCLKFNLSNCGKSADKPPTQYKAGPLLVCNLFEFNIDLDLDLF